MAGVTIKQQIYIMFYKSNIFIPIITLGNITKQVCIFNSNMHKLELSIKTYVFLILSQLK